jgi:phage gpG-like protein
MDAQLVVDTRELDAMIRRFNGAKPIVDREAQVALERSAIIVQNDAKVRVPVDTGALRASLAREVTANDARVGSNLTYAPVVEYGRRAGAPPPPASALVGWVTRHGMDEGAAYAVAKTIGRFGIKARPYLVPALLQNVTRIEREFSLATDRALVKLGFR